MHPWDTPRSFAADSASRRAYIGGLAPTTTQQSIEQYCESVGMPILTCTIYTFSDGKPKGCGHVQFRDTVHRERFLEQHYHMIDGKKVEAKPFEPKANVSNGIKANYGRTIGHDHDTHILISDIESTMTVVQLKNYFSRFGHVVSCSGIRQRPATQNRTNYVAYLKFNQSSSADDCLAHGSQHLIENQLVHIERTRSRWNNCEEQPREGSHQPIRTPTFSPDDHVPTRPLTPSPTNKTDYPPSEEGQLDESKVPANPLSTTTTYDHSDDNVYRLITRFITEHMQRLEEQDEKRRFDEQRLLHQQFDDDTRQHVQENARLHAQVEQLQQELTLTYEKLTATTKKFYDLQGEYNAVVNELITVKQVNAQALSEDEYPLRSSTPVVPPAMIKRRKASATPSMTRSLEEQIDYMENLLTEAEKRRDDKRDETTSKKQKL